MSYGPHWRRLADECKRRDHYTCSDCGWTARRRERHQLHADHVVPRNQGGPDALHNLVTRCWRCHSKKTSYGKAARQQAQVERLFRANAQQPRYRRPLKPAVPIFGY